MDNGGTLTITGGTFSGNQATQGGAIINNSYYASINDSAGTLFSSNTASLDAGAISTIRATFQSSRPSLPATRPNPVPMSPPAEAPFAIPVMRISTRVHSPPTRPMAAAARFRTIPPATCIWRMTPSRETRRAFPAADSISQAPQFPPSTTPSSRKTRRLQGL